MFWAEYAIEGGKCKTFNPQDTLDYEVEMSLWNKFNKLYAEVFAD
jgi:hypothetical protein